MSGRFEDRLKEFGEQPELTPPPAAEAPTLAAMARATHPARRIVPARAAIWVVVIGAATLVASLALDSGRETDLAAVAAAPAAAGSEYIQLIAASVLLEETLRQLPPPRQVMRVSTAGTVVALEDRISLIDAEFERAAAEAGPPEYRTALLRERVDAMNALVNVRYAQSSAFSF